MTRIRHLMDPDRRIAAHTRTPMPTRLESPVVRGCGCKDPGRRASLASLPPPHTSLPPLAEGVPATEEPGRVGRSHPRCLRSQLAGALPPTSARLSACAGTFLPQAGGQPRGAGRSLSPVRPRPSLPPERSDRGEYGDGGAGRGAGTHQGCLRRDRPQPAGFQAPLPPRPRRAGRNLSPVRLRLRGNSRSLRSLGGTAARGTGLTFQEGGRCIKGVVIPTGRIRGR